MYVPYVEWQKLLWLTGNLNSAIFQFEMRDEPMPAETAYQLVHDELQASPRAHTGIPKTYNSVLQGDGSTSLNLASFVTTYMEPHAVSTACAYSDIGHPTESP